MQAWTFLEFALGPEGQRIAAEPGRTVPSLRSVAETEAFLDPTRAARELQVFLDQIPFLRSVPVISTWPEIEDTVNGLLEEAYYGGGRALEVAIELDGEHPRAVRARRGLMGRCRAPDPVAHGDAVRGRASPRS